MASQLKDSADLRRLAAQCGYSSAALARKLGLSRRHLHNQWIRNFRMSPGKWLREQRVRDATLLLTTGTRVKDVAEKVGFRHRNGFTAAFVQVTGKTPSSILRGRGT